MESTSDSPAEEAIPVEVKQEEAPFSICFTANEAGDLTVGIKWPQEGINPSQVAQTLAIMLHRISNGEWKPIMVRGVQARGIDCNQMDVAQAILEHWGALATEERGSALCVDPTQVFKGKPNEAG